MSFGWWSAECLKLLLQLLKLLIEHNLLSFEVFDDVRKVFTSLLLLLRLIRLRFLGERWRADWKILRTRKGMMIGINGHWANRHFDWSWVVIILSLNLQRHVIAMSLCILDHTAMCWLSLFEIKHVCSAQILRLRLFAKVCSVFVLVADRLNLMIILVVHVCLEDTVMMFVGVMMILLSLMIGLLSLFSGLLEMLRWYYSIFLLIFHRISHWWLCKHLIVLSSGNSLNRWNTRIRCVVIVWLS